MLAIFLWNNEACHSRQSGVRIIVYADPLKLPPVAVDQIARIIQEPASPTSTPTAS